MRDDRFHYKHPLNFQTYNITEKATLGRIPKISLLNLKRWDATVCQLLR
jgi:hypothetical protein